MKYPSIPMHPSLLPQQRLYEVLGLPPRPEALNVFVGYPGQVPYEALPKRKPRSPIYLCQVEWAWSPAHSRVDAYYLHASTKCWFLWLCYLDDNCYPWEWRWEVVGGVLRRGVSDRDAASHLLLAYWSYDKATEDVDQFHWINEDGFLSVAEVMAIASAVWGN